MSSRIRVAAFLACCIAGWASLVWLFPRFDASVVHWHATASHQQVREAAARLASRYGIDTNGWDFYITARSSRERMLARLERPQSGVLTKFTNLEYVVVASRSGTPANLRIVLGSDLRPIAFRAVALRRGSGQGRGERKRFPEGPGPAGGRPPVEPIDAGRVSAIASQLKLYAGADADRYRQTALLIPTPEGLMSAWEWGEQDQQGILARLRVYVRRGGINRVDHELEIAQPVIAERLGRYQLQQSFANPGRSLFLFLTVSLGCWYFFRSMATSFVPLRFALANLPLAAVPVLVDFFLGPDHDRIVINAFRNDNTVMAQLSTSALFIALGLGAVIIILTAGRSIVPRSERHRWMSLQHIYLKRLFARSVGWDILAGLAVGPAIAAVPYLVLAASGRMDLAIDTIGPQYLTAARPWASALGEAAPWVSIAAFALVRPWALRTSPTAGASGPLLALFGIVATVLFIDPLQGSRVLAIEASSLLFLALWLAYQCLGLMAVWLASISGAIATVTLGFLHSGLKAEAWSAAAPFLLLAAVGAGILAFGRVEKPQEILDSFQILPRERIVSERARLDAEFSVATTAQQRLLPSHPPVVPGYSLAASCTPAREVGGDLFEYMELPGGAVGLCVADVSGKGVPAALYMTLTKGMLASAQPKNLPLPLLASRLNRHLLATGQRKTFVTMSIAVLEPGALRFRHVRAGHNPPLLFRAATRKTELLKPRGLGLGLASTATFERILHEQSVDLQKGDIVVLYSDGLTEMMAPDNELFGEERLARVVSENAHHGAQAIHDAVLAAARRFQDDAEQHDDLTLLVLKTEISLT